MVKGQRELVIMLMREEDFQQITRKVQGWKPLLPLGLAHANNEDDTYKGYYIPKGVFTFSSRADAEAAR